MGILHWSVLSVCVCGNFRFSIGGDVVKRYQVKLQHFKNGANGTTRYSFSTKLKSVIFAAGYQAAIYDMGRTDLYVSVWSTDPLDSKRGFHNVERIADSDALLEVASREC